MLSWRRRADSNRRIGVLQTPALDRLATSPDNKMLVPRRRLELLQPVKATAPSTLRVYQFHHLGIAEKPSIPSKSQRLYSV
jgi:hypothetical protein